MSWSVPNNLHQAVQHWSCVESLSLVKDTSRVMLSLFTLLDISYKIKTCLQYDSLQNCSALVSGNDQVVVIPQPQ